jgi:tetratricopeptide (TPR) repeat protein
MPENPRIEELRRRVLADPASIAFAALAEEFRRVGRYDEAIETCRTGLQRHPAYLSARVTLGRALIETGDFDAAREELDTVLRSAPENLAAIRGLAQIHERLGHSAEMDPHLADMMKTMHAESIRVAERPPDPSAAPPAVAPEPLPEPVRFQAPEPTPELSLAPQPQPEPDPEPPADARGPVDDAWATPMPEPAARVEALTDPFAAFVSTSKPEPIHVFSFDAAPTPAIEAGPIAPPEPEIEPEIEPDTEPDPDVLATLARLERFLGTIQSLRA